MRNNSTKTVMPFHVFFSHNTLVEVSQANFEDRQGIKEILADRQTDAADGTTVNVPRLLTYLGPLFGEGGQETGKSGVFHSKSIGELL